MFSFWKKKKEYPDNLDDPKIQQTEEEKQTGLFVNLTNREIITYKLFKEWVKDQNLYYPEFDDWYLIRFCIGKNFKLKKIQQVFETNCERREFYNVSNVLHVNFDVVHEYMPNVLTERFTGINKFGRPIKVQKYHKLCAKSIMQCDLHKWWQWNFRVVEEMTNVVFPYCSKIANKRIDNLVVIIDMGDCDMKPLQTDKQLRRYFEAPTQLGQECYPELMGQLWFVNIPKLFSICWGFLKMFLSERTLDKTKIFGRNQDYQTEMHELLGKENIPDFLGGEIKDWVNHQMPWSKYQSYCIKQKSFYPNNEKPCSDPLKKAQTFNLDQCKEQELNFDQTQDVKLDAEANVDEFNSVGSKEEFKSVGSKEEEFKSVESKEKLDVDESRE